MTRGLTFLFILKAFLCYGQQNDLHPFWGKVRYGGGLGLGFGNDSFNLQLAPSAIYEANTYYSTGMGLQLNYAKFGEDKFLGYGAAWMNFFSPVPMIQLSTELEQWRVNLSNDSLGTTIEDNYWLTALFLGVGYQSNGVTFGVRYDVLYDEERSIYADPWIPFVRVFF
ncbi:MAG: alpha-ketoglutarate decarboxylase [Bacteroidota bacterium]